MTSPLIIIGAGGHGAEIAAYALEMGLLLVGAIDDGKSKGAWQTSQIIGGMNELPALCQAPSEVHFITAVGSNDLRKMMVFKIAGLSLSNLKPFTLQHTSAWTGVDVQIGEGTLLAPNVIVTTRVRIGRHCILNIRASVSHDCHIGDFVNINPAATLCGNVTVGDGSFIGAGAVVKEKITIGRGVTVGAGAVVIRDLPDGVTAVGVPAHIITTVKTHCAAFTSRTRAPQT
jgi:acetyltransferase EpsM